MDCHAACQRSEEECVACLAGGMPQLVTNGETLVALALEKGKITGTSGQRLRHALAELTEIWAEHFPLFPPA